MSCVNSIDSSYPEYVEYSTVRIPQAGVHINTEQGFLTGCDCVDDCMDKYKCSCRQLTMQSTKGDSENRLNPEVGYEYKRLDEMVVTGIYECNQLCKCAKTCLNRVVQHPLKLKLQVFKTVGRGWGIRALTVIPAGTFILSYVGNLYSSVEGNKQGNNFGDEYFADLDMIEVIESRKDGYESDASSDEGMTSSASEYCPSDENGASSGDDLRGLTKKYNGRKRVIKKSVPKKTASHSPGKIKNAVNYISTRKLFGVSEEPYIMDAKTTGNIGRYFNYP